MQILMPQGSQCPVALNVEQGEAASAPAISTEFPAETTEQTQLLQGWKVGDNAKSLSEVHSSVSVPAAGSAWYRKAAAFAGLGGMIAVGYMDPGNW